MRTSLFLLAATPLLLLTGCSDAIARGFAEEEPPPTTYGAVVDAGTPSALAATPIDVTVRTPAPTAPRTYHVGGTVFGLASGETLVLENKGGDDLTFVADARFTFPITVDTGHYYVVDVKTQPVHQTCAVRDGHGVMGSANVTDVSVECGAVTFPVGGVVSNLHGTLVLHDSTGGDVTLAQDGSFYFPTHLPAGSSYDVTVGTQPDGQQCVVSRATKTGTVYDDAVTSLVVGCTDFANASFANDFTGWTLTSDDMLDSYGGAAIVPVGTTLSQGSVIHEVISNTDVSLDYVSDALPMVIGTQSSSSSGQVALLCSANGPVHVIATQDLALASVVSALTFDFQYASGAPTDDAEQYIHVQLVDPTTSAVLTTLLSIGTGSDPKAMPSTITTDVSAYAGQTVRLQLETYAFDGPIYAGFDSFTLQ